MSQRLAPRSTARALNRRLVVPLCSLTISLSHSVSLSLAGGDDYGWSDAGWHNPTGDLRTPTMNALVADGIEFDRHYVFKCEFISTKRGAMTEFLRRH